MFRPAQTRFGPGDILAAAIVVIGLTILLVPTLAHFVVAFEYRRQASEFAQKGNAEQDELRRQGIDPGENARNSLKFVGSTFASLAAVGLALACIPPLRSLMHRIGLVGSGNRKKTAESRNRPLRIYLKMLGASAILATILYALMHIGILLSDD